MKIMEYKYEKYIGNKKCISEHNFLVANQTMLPIVREKLEKGQPVIYDGNFYYKSQIDDLIFSLKFCNFIFTLKANLSTCIVRNKMRANNLKEQAVRDVFELNLTCNYGILVDTNNKTIAQTVDEIASIVRRLPCE